MCRFTAAACGLALALALPGCSGDDSPAATSTSATTPPSTAAGPTLALKDAPLVVTIKSTAGKLSRDRRSSAKASIGRVVNGWLQGGFIGGDYPRADFTSAFARFTAGAALDAERDKALLTNATLGPELVDVAARRRLVKLSILAAHRRPQGASARIHLTLAGVRDDGSVLDLYLSGDLYLTRTDGNTWKIFGFDLNRSVKGSS
jgi:hypothetical protein